MCFKVLLICVVIGVEAQVSPPQTPPVRGQQQVDRRIGLTTGGPINGRFGGFGTSIGTGPSYGGQYGLYGIPVGLGGMYSQYSGGLGGQFGGLYGGGGVYGGQGLTLNDVYAVYGPNIARIEGAVYSTRDLQFVPVPSQYEPPTPVIVDIDPVEQPLVLNFGSRSSSLFAVQSHEGQQGSVQRTQSVDEPHHLIHEVIRPVIQEVREVIQPERRIVQEITPIVENIQTIVSRGEGQRPVTPLAGAALGATVGTMGAGAIGGGLVGTTGLMGGGGGLIGTGGGLVAPGFIGYGGPITSNGILGGAGLIPVGGTYGFGGVPGYLSYSGVGGGPGLGAGGMSGSLGGGGLAGGAGGIVGGMGGLAGGAGGFGGSTGGLGGSGSTTFALRERAIRPIQQIKEQI